VLPSLTREFDLGPAVQLYAQKDLVITKGETNGDFSAYYGLWVRQHWLPSVLRVLEIAAEAPEALTSHRQSMMRYARHTFSWARSALTLMEIFDKAERGPVRAV
jgi:hypothetical protein